MYRPNHFTLPELVPPLAHAKYGTKLWRVFDDRILRAADILRDVFGPMVVNDWHRQGNNKYRGWRPPACRIGANLSQHRFGRALDLIPLRITAEVVRQTILETPDMVRDDAGNYLITAMERDVSWLHIDCRSHDVERYGIQLFAG